MTSRRALRLLDDARASIPFATAETRLEEAEPAAALSAVAVQVNASEVVVGSHRPGHEAPLIGAALVRSLERPVTVVPPSATIEAGIRYGQSCGTRLALFENEFQVDRFERDHPDVTLDRILVHSQSGR